jgi:excisionase family DNA binding protein
MGNMAETWLTTTQAAELGGYHREHVRKLIKAKKVKAQKFGRDWMVSRSSLLAHMKAVEKLGAKRGPKPKGA